MRAAAMKRTGSGIFPHLEALRGRELDAGGFSHRPGGEYRADATAWAVMALTAAGTRKDLLEKSRSRLAAGQKQDGRVCISPEHPEAFWPTPLAILAWNGSPAYREALSRAVRFLQDTTGIHFEKDPEAPVTHDSSIRGWPWIAKTHSMVEPTALSLIALRIAGHGEHERTREAARMLMDRQLPAGGWNYGNTFVYGQELYPQPENTGIALDALAGSASREDVLRSLQYLAARTERIRTPLSLGWALLGLGAWEARPGRARPWLMESFELQGKYGPYDTTLLSLLLLAYLATGGLASVTEKKEIS
ncbi:MAG: prenyltransferase/squalene oxidase repeat-containing protein [Candidatus Deferrimicrobiaceae bacterium]